MAGRRQQARPGNARDAREIDRRYADEYREDYAYGDGYDGTYDDGYDDGYGYDDGDGGYGYDEDYGGGWQEPPRRGAGAFFGYLGDHNLTLFLLLLLLPPVGVALLWWRRRFRRRGRVLLTVMTLLWVAALAFLLAGRPLLNRRNAPEDAVETTDASNPGQTNPVIVSDEALDDAIGVYVTETGPFYHQLQDCRGLSTTEEITRMGQNAALDSGRMACPYCLGGQYTDGLWDLKLVNLETQDQSGIEVYCSAGDASFHTDAQCQALSGGRSVTLLDAVLMGKTPCQTCCPEASRQVFCTLDGNFYHYDGECSGMRNPSLVNLPEALILGKTRCPTCIKDAGGLSLEETETGSDTTYYVYATRNGTYFHIKKNCSGMKDAKKVPLKQMLAARRPACPRCCPNVEMVVYTERGNPYYHSTDSCSGMKDPARSTLVQALADGLTRCPNCWTTAQ